MLTIVHTARGVARTLPGVGLAFVMPQKKADATLLERARAFAREGEARHDQFVLHGLAPTFVTDLLKLVDTFERAAERRRQGRRGLAAAGAALADAVARGHDAVRALDVVVINTFRGDPGALAAWRVARRLEGASRGTKRPAADAEPVAGAPVAVDAGASDLRKVS
jgi:hypothetical protein